MPSPLSPGRSQPYYRNTRLFADANRTLRDAAHFRLLELQKHRRMVSPCRYGQGRCVNRCAGLGIGSTRCMVFGFGWPSSYLSGRLPGWFVLAAVKAVHVAVTPGYILWRPCHSHLLVERPLRPEGLFLGRYAHRRVGPSSFKNLDLLALWHLFFPDIAVILRPVCDPWPIISRQLQSSANGLWATTGLPRPAYRQYRGLYAYMFVPALIGRTGFLPPFGGRLRIYLMTAQKSRRFKARWARTINMV